MPEPQPGEPFPDFDLEEFSTRSARKRGPVAVVVWKTECPTCRLAVPFFDRIHRAFPSATVVGVGQNQPNELEQYAGTSGLKMPSYADTSLRVTRSLGVHTVPTYWLVDQNGLVQRTAGGWSAAEMESLSQALADLTQTPYVQIVRPEDNVPASKPG